LTDSGQKTEVCVFREELGKGINTDEAAALGAVYQAANLGKGFKVKKFGIKDATVYPIKVRAWAVQIFVMFAFSFVMVLSSYSMYQQCVSLCVS